MMPPMTAGPQLRWAGQCLIVMYHYVRPWDPGLPAFRALSPEAFERQLDALARRWTFLSLDGWFDAMNRGTEPARVCIVTFDDGVRDHHDVVLPILSRRGIPGAFFVSTRPIEEERMLTVHMVQHLVARLSSAELCRRLEAVVRSLAGHDDGNRLLTIDQAAADRVYHYEPEPETRRAKYLLNFVLSGEIQERVVASLFAAEFGDEREFARRFYLSKAGVQALAKAGMIVGSHGHRHVPMSACRRAEKGFELQRSRELLEHWTGAPVTAFCFPWGGPAHIDDESAEMLAEAGYFCALTTLDGVNEGEIARYYLQRRDCVTIADNA